MVAVAAVSWGWCSSSARQRMHVLPGPRQGLAPRRSRRRHLRRIEFGVGTSLRAVPAPTLVDGGLELPDAMRGTFRLDGVRWRRRAPTTLRPWSSVSSALGPWSGIRSLPRCAEATVQRSRRARSNAGSAPRPAHSRRRSADRTRAHGAILLADGIPVVDVVRRLEYFDEPHLARALRRYIGRTSRQLRERSGGAIALNLVSPRRRRPSSPRRSGRPRRRAGSASACPCPIC